MTQWEALWETQRRARNALLACGLSVRATNAFINSGILTLEDAANWTERELLKLPNFGRKSLNEVRAALAERGLTLKPGPQIPLSERVAKLERAIATHKKALAKARAELRALKSGGV